MQGVSELVRRRIMQKVFNAFIEEAAALSEAEFDQIRDSIAEELKTLPLATVKDCRVAVRQAEFLNRAFPL